MTDQPMTNIVQCRFHVRRPAVDGLFHYDDINIAGPNGGCFFDTPHPPAVGDHIWLANEGKDHGGMYKVIARDWGYSQYGSVNWPITEPHPRTGPMMNVILEPAKGLFHDQTPLDVEEDE